MTTAIIHPRPDVTGVLSAIDSALDDWTVSGDAMRMAPPQLDAVFSWEIRNGCNTEPVFAVFSNVSLESLLRLQPGDRIWVDGIPRRIDTRFENEGCVNFTLGEIWPVVG